MMPPDVTDIAALDCELRRRLTVIRRLSVAVRCLTVVVYAAVLCWIAYCICTPFRGWSCGHGASDDTWIFVASAFAVFLVLHFLQTYGLAALGERETQVMRQAVRRLFPNAAYSANSTLPGAIIRDSALFELFSDDADFTCYGSVAFRGGSDPTTIYDIGVTEGRLSGILSRLPAAGFLTTLYRSVVRPIFGTPVESSRHSFRGMFGMHSSPLRCRGNVILLPDRLESRIGYLAHSVQSYRRRNGARHVILEDVGFENLFAVYADDEVEARKILTPAMMQRLTTLRRDFGRELLISFAGDRIYYAVPFPGGFLRPSRQSPADGKLLERLYHDINLGRRLIRP